MLLRFHPFSDKNRLGYYSVGDYCTYSKIDAIEVGNKTGNTVEWHFNDETFDSLNWQQSPEASLWDLYTARAQQLREKYDYIVLMYSGGADSHNILNVFVRNGIHIDEIAQYTNMDGTGEKDNFWNAEVYNVAAPVTAAVIEQYQLKTKHRLIDLSAQLTTLDKQMPDLDDWIYQKNSNLSVNARVLTNIKHTCADYMELMHRGKNVCFIWGAEKPPFVTASSPSTPGVLYPAAQFRDSFDSCFNIVDQMENNTWINDEMFYWNANCPELIVKQVHIVNDFLKTAGADHPFLSKTFNSAGAKIIGGVTYYLTNEGINQLVYPYWDPATFSVGKPSSQLIGERDFWLLKDNNNIRKMLLDTIRETQQKLQDKWTGLKRGPVLYYSPAYPLGPQPADAVPLGQLGDDIRTRTRKHLHKYSYDRQQSLVLQSSRLS